jgi:transcriptional regulator with PAS, ATPase and Fis domain
MIKNENQITNVLIVGAGRAGNSLLELFIKDVTTNIVGVVDLNPDALGIINAKKYSIPVAKHPKYFLDSNKNGIDVVFDVTGNKKVLTELKTSASKDVILINGKAAKFVWDLIEVSKNNSLLKEQFINLKESLTDNHNEDIIYGSNPLMQQVREMIHQVAPTPTTVLVLGETGTGKEMIATAIQKLSTVADESFVKINCTAFSSQLLESELFGYVKGAFTGATKDKKGLLEKGDKGTIFLDEIGDVSMEMQVKLLRFLQFGEIRPVGSTKTKVIKARIITATNKNLEKLIKEGKFREDLYYRLNIFAINLPPLRHRKEDIPVLAYLFLNKSAATLNKKITSISTSAMESLNEYNYPGNIRELHSIIERAMILCNENSIKPEHLTMGVRSSNSTYKYDNGLSYSKKNVIEQFERQALQHYLIKAKGNVTNASKLAKSPRRSFYRMLEKYKIDNTQYKNMKN